MIRVAIVDDGYAFALRVKNFFAENYSEEFDVEAFDSVMALKEYALFNEVHIVLIEDKNISSAEGLNEDIMVAKLTESAVPARISAEDKIPTIPMYQKAENFHRQFIELNELRNLRIKERELRMMPAKVITFLSVMPGAGNSTVAHALAERVKDSRKTLIININNIITEDEFGTSKQHTLDLYNKMKVTGRTIKGTDYLMAEKSFSDEDNRQIINTIEQIKEDREYKYIIVDLGFDYSKVTSGIFQISEKIALTVPCTKSGAAVVESMEDVLKKMENSTGEQVLNKAGIVYNRISRENSAYAENTQLETFGGIKLLDVSGVEEGIREISGMKFLDNLL